jgi:hypothetical protein
MASQGSSAGGSMSDFRKMGKASMESELSIGAGDSTATDVVSAIGGVLNTKGAAMNADIKKRYNEKQKSVDEFGKKLELAFIDMGPEMENLGQESYQKAQDDVFGLREEYASCEGLGEPGAIKKCQADIMIKLNTTKTRHSTDAENAKNLAGLWQGELDEDGNRGEPSADVKAMSDDDAGIMEQFVSNKSKRVVYLNEDGSGPGDILHYEWDVPNPKYMSADLTPNEPEFITKPYSNDYLQEMIPIKETVNGEKYQDYLEAEKQKVANGQSPADNAALKKAVGDMIPKTQQALRSWAYSNPAAQDYLNVHEYLVDHPILNGQYEKLELPDIAGKPNPKYISDEETPNEPKQIGDGVINHADFIASEDKESIIKKIMNADDVNLSHEILTDIYASVGGNEISGAPNKDYHPERHELPNRTNEEVTKASIQQETLNKLKTGPEGGETPQEMATRLNIKVGDKFWDPDTKQYVSISTLYPTKGSENKSGGKPR